MKIKTYNITNKILSDKILNSEIFGVFPENGKFLPRFNPGLIHLIHNIYMISYRIWIDLESENIYKYPEIFDSGSPWMSNWSPYLKCFDYKNFVSDENVQMRNYGLAIIKMDDEEIEVLYDQIMTVDYPYYFVEDGRLFEDKDGIIRILFSACSFEINDDIFFKNIAKYNTERFMITIEIGKKEKILHEIFTDINKLYDDNNIINLLKDDKYIKTKIPNILCPQIHKNSIEKNWSVWTSNGCDYLTYFTMPYGTPLIHVQVLNFDEINNWNCKIDENVLYNLECLKNNKFLNLSLINLKNIISEYVNFFENFNFYYYYSIKFSGGSQCIRFNEHENIGIGHAVIDITKIKKNINYLENNQIDILYLMKKYNLEKYLAEILYYNLLNFYNRPLADSNKNYSFHHNKYAYMMFFYTFNYNYPFNLKRISHIFSPKFCKYNTGVVFPCGIQIVNNYVIVSYGESDNQSCIFKVSNIDVENSLLDINNIHPLEVFFYEYQFE
jgi:predicted GH43/DUF377 family glycosyl hydrolase